MYDDYQAVHRTICSKIRSRERAVLKQIQEDYDAKAPSKDIAEQLSGSDEFSKHPSPIVNSAKHVFCERSRIAKTFFCEQSVFESKAGQARRLQVIHDMISLCALQERRAPRTSRKLKTASDILADQKATSPMSKKRKFTLDYQEDEENDASSPRFCTLDPSICKRKPADAEDIPLKCQSFQCLFYIGNLSLPLNERLRAYKNKYSLQRHTYRCCLKSVRSDDELNCPHPSCSGLVLQGVNHFKNHAAIIHDIHL